MKKFFINLLFLVILSASSHAAYASVATVSLACNPEGAAVLSGGGTYSVGAMAEVTVSANPGFTFVGWTDGEELVSTSMVYKFEVTGDVELTANLEQNRWVPNSTAYSDNMSLIAVVEIDGVEQNDNKYEIGAFCGDEVRSSQRLFHEYIENSNGNVVVDRYMAYLQIYGTDDDMITFKLYDHETDTEFEESEVTVKFINNTNLGNLFNPYVLTFTMPDETFTFIGSGSWNDVSNWNNSTLPTENDDVVLNGDATISDEIIINSLVIKENCSLTIQNGGFLKVNGKFVNTDVDALIIEDGGQIIQTNENVAATFEKKIVRPSEQWGEYDETGWNFVSSPVINSEVADFIPANDDYDLYKYDGSREFQWVNYKSNEDFEDEFVLGQAYLVSYQSQDTAAFRGILNNETEYFDFEISYDANNEWANIYLLGNPFGFDIDWYDMYYSTKRMDDGFATLNGTTGAYVYNIDGCIKVGDGFMVHTKGKNPMLEYERSAKSRSEKTDYINITASSNKGSDNVIVRFGDEVASSFPKLANFNEDVARIYVKDNDAACGILSYDSDVKEIPLYFEAKEIGGYTLTFDIKGNYENVVLMDKNTGENVNLLMQDEYVFRAMANDNPERFVLYMSVNKEESCENFAYVDNGVIVIGDVCGLATINVFDIMGRCVYNTDARNIPVDRLCSGTYIIQKNDDNGVKTQKIIL